jgi:hypothetical protein
MIPNQLSNVLGAAAVVALLAFAAAPQAEAALIACPANIQDNVSGANDCGISTADQDNTNDPLVVNTADGGFFGFTDWEFIKKDEGATGQGQAGTYDFGTAFDTFDDVMLVFKDGGNTTLVAYTDFDTASGTWTTPFENPPFSVTNPADVSHISYYGRDGDDPPVNVPEPASLAIFGTALLGLGFIARRRRDV